jgi:hypothetical protein
MELVRLGQHTDDEIKNRLDEIGKSLQQEGISDQQKSSLERERTTLQLERQGNQIVGDMLRSLDSIGQRQNLKLSDFTLSTDLKKDLPQFKASINKVTRGGKREVGALFFRGHGIIINGGSTYYKSIAAGFGILPTKNLFDMLIPRQDIVVAQSTELVHERTHRDLGATERAAYTEQMRVLQQYGPGAFRNESFYDYYRQGVQAGKGGKE